MNRLTNSDKEIPTLSNNAEYWLQAYFKLKEYEDLEEQGLLLKLPCKVGDTVYQIDAERVYESEVKWIIFDCDDIAFDERAIGVSIFLTREEAEAALKGGESDA